MKPENEKYLRTQFPFIRCYADVGDGWFPILKELCEAIAEYVPEDFQVFQIKEKFGGLRFYHSSAEQKVYDLVSQAENDSLSTCEICGEPGEERVVNHWIHTRCDKHIEPTS